jgi:hypothetical protein
MSNRRVKDIEYDDDGYDSYGDDYKSEGADELTEDDKLQLQEGAAKVKSLLGSDVAVTDKQIQDALWYYFYDIEKSVTFLKNVKKPKQTQAKAKAVPPITNGKSNRHACFHSCYPGEAAFGVSNVGDILVCLIPCNLPCCSCP